MTKNDTVLLQFLCLIHFIFFMNYHIIITYIGYTNNSQGGHPLMMVNDELIIISSPNISF